MFINTCVHLGTYNIVGVLFFFIWTTILLFIHTNQKCIQIRLLSKKK